MANAKYHEQGEEGNVIAIISIKSPCPSPQAASHLEKDGKELT